MMADTEIRSCLTCKFYDLTECFEPCRSCLGIGDFPFYESIPTEPPTPVNKSEGEGIEKEAEQVIEDFYQIVHDIVDVNNGYWYARELANKHCDLMTAKLSKLLNSGLHNDFGIRDERNHYADLKEAINKLYDRALCLLWHWQHKS